MILLTAFAGKIYPFHNPYTLRIPYKVYSARIRRKSDKGPVSFVEGKTSCGAERDRCLEFLGSADDVWEVTTPSKHYTDSECTDASKVFLNEECSVYSTKYFTKIYNFWRVRNQ